MTADEPKLAWAATRRGLAETIATIEVVLPGSVVTRRMRCGKTNCACHTDVDRRHGPYHQWTRTVDGTTVTRYLNDEQLQRYQPWFDNARRLKQLVADLETASIAAVEQDAGWTTSS